MCDPRRNTDHRSSQRDDYIFLKPNGGTTIYRNVYAPGNDGNKYRAMPDADASGIGQSPEEIDLVDIDGDGRADYVWTRKLDGRVRVWYNQYPAQPTWREGGEIAGGVGTSGANVRYARLQVTGRADYVAVDPLTGALGAWLGACADPDTAAKKNRVSIGRGTRGPPGDDLEHVWLVKMHEEGEEDSGGFCDYDGAQAYEYDDVDPRDWPTAIWQIPKLFGSQCFYVGGVDRIGRMVCDGVRGTRCFRDPQAGIGPGCGNELSGTRLIICEW